MYNQPHSANLLASCLIAFGIPTYKEIEKRNGVSHVHSSQDYFYYIEISMITIHKPDSCLAVFGNNKPV